MNVSIPEEIGLRIRDFPLSKNYQNSIACQPDLGWFWNKDTLVFNSKTANNICHPAPRTDVGHQMRFAANIPDLRATRFESHKTLLCSRL